ncbi:polysaccharide deacetylase family protein [Streptomyces sp. FZ201]|uniref:polysaccharide deacetylase family protein n=1 Tax=Streptomyces sp. FZ201 TaxID=3057122 RepID=UPI0021C15E79|nr:polysaccharide deacetylase family protein [Streptomyces sp. FZ201]
MSHHSYGPDVGVPRILELLKETGTAATFFIPGWVAEHRPHLASDIVEAGHEVAHHSYSNHPPTAMPVDEEREDFERAVAVFAKQDIPVAGHRAAHLSATWLTAELVAEYGLLYDSSMRGDDQPYRLPTERGAVTEIPVNCLTSNGPLSPCLPTGYCDVQAHSPRQALQAWVDELDAVRHCNGLFTLAVDPSTAGRPAWVAALRKLIEYVQEAGDIALARCQDIAHAASLDSSVVSRRVTLPNGLTKVYPAP